MSAANVAFPSVSRPSMNGTLFVTRVLSPWMLAYRKEEMGVVVVTVFTRGGEGG